jgi:hypothetical protein
MDADSLLPATFVRPADVWLARFASDTARMI